MSGLVRKRARSLRMARIYRIGQTVEVLRGHLVELEVVVRDLAHSGEASNQDLGVELVRVAVRVFKLALRLVRACRLIAGGK